MSPKAPIMEAIKKSVFRHPTLIQVWPLEQTGHISQKADLISYGAREATRPRQPLVTPCSPLENQSRVIEQVGDMDFIYVYTHTVLNKTTKHKAPFI